MTTDPDNNLRDSGQTEDLDQSPKSGQKARKRLIGAAEKLFAENGFERTSIRQITDQAQCNIAAVNYHFGGKYNLYIEVFRRRLLLLRDIRVDSINELMAGGKDVTLEELLRTFTGAFLEPLVTESDGRRLTKLMLREMTDPHLPPAMFFEEMVAPVLSTFLKALLDVCPGLNRNQALHSIRSVIGQLVHIVAFQEILDRAEIAEMPKLEMSEVIEHVVAFSAAGIGAYAKGTG